MEQETHEGACRLYSKERVRERARECTHKSNQHMQQQLHIHMSVLSKQSNAITYPPLEFWFLHPPEVHIGPSVAPETGIRTGCYVCLSSVDPHPGGISQFSLAIFVTAGMQQRKTQASRCRSYCFGRTTTMAKTLRRYGLVNNNVLNFQNQTCVVVVIRNRNGH
jgi:hypothetical protein